MDKDIKDYLHYYLGCEIIHDTRKYRGSLSAIGWHTATIFCDYFKRDSGHVVPKGKEFGHFDILIERLKLILRPLSDMTEDEAIELIKLNTWKQYGDHPHDREYKTYKNSFGQLVVSWGDGLREKNVPVTKEAFYPNEIVYLLSKHFDLFGLIESGLAIDKTKQRIYEAD